ncbi:MAG TPA: zinc-binding dehydrogenase [Frankiaceae bacterium]|jgi:threonine dehydrogenase-like Zn-dependent dehydrogenase|nr:zinc-binding dehydrogenase [Frankiaceae bacterium]
MRAAYLPGGRRVDLRDVPVPEPGPGQLLLKMGASTICGSDLRAIYREHLGVGAEAYQGVIGGHEPCGQVVRRGPGVTAFAEGDRVVVYHIAGCGSCPDCMAGYDISCQRPERAAYGWQRDGGHAEYILVEERSLVPLPDDLSYLDGASVACSVGTAYEALCRVDVGGRDTTLVTGLGPVGLAAGLLAKKMGATCVIGVDIAEERRALAREVGAVDEAIPAEDAVAEIKRLTQGHGCETAIDCSGSPQGRVTAIDGARRWGRVAMVGEGGRLDVDVSHQVIHRNLTILGSWVTSRWRTAELLERLVRWRLHPEVLVTHQFPLDRVAEAYEVADSGVAGKVAVTQ